MQCTIFYGEKDDVEEAFNEWGKGKTLSKDIIIHTFAHASGKYAARDLVLIAIYYPDDYDKESE